MGLRTTRLLPAAAVFVLGALALLRIAVRRSDRVRLGLEDLVLPWGLHLPLLLGLVALLIWLRERATPSSAGARLVPPGLVLWAAFLVTLALIQPSPLLAAVGAAGFWLGSTLFHYTVAESVMAHAPAAAVSSLLVLLWLRAREAPQRAGRWVAVALAGGLLVSVQRYDVYLLLPAVLSAMALVRARLKTGEPAQRRHAALAMAGAGTAFAVAVLPMVFLSLRDRFLLSLDVVPSHLADWARPHVVPLLFSSNGGLFAWTPLAVPAVLGLVLLARRDRGVGLTLLLTLALGVYLLASTPTWSAGVSFGARRLTEAYPILVLGLCVSADAILRRPWAPTLALLVLFVVQNTLISTNVRLGNVPQGNATSFARATQLAVGSFYEAVGHPGSWPANWHFALRHGVTPDRFDELYGRLSLSRVAVKFGSPGDGAVRGRGWARVEEGQGGRWAVGEVVVEPTP